MSPLPPLDPNANPQTPTPRKSREPLAPPLAVPNGMRQRAQLPMRAWDTPGQKVYAYFLAVRDSTKFQGRKLVDLVDDDGVVETWPCPVILEQLLRGLQPQTVVYIHYRGEEPGAKGDTKQFEVFVSDRTKAADNATA